MYISIPSTACAARQPVCPNKQAAEGGCLIITSPLLSLSPPEFTFHLTTNTGPRLRICPLSPLEFRGSQGNSSHAVRYTMRTEQYKAASWEGRRRGQECNEDSLCPVLRECEVGRLNFSTVCHWKISDSCTRLAQKPKLFTLC